MEEQRLIQFIKKHILSFRNSMELPMGSEINLGDRVKDRITGLSGIVTSVTKFLYGCKRIGIQPETKKDGKPADTFCIDEDQAELIKRSAIRGFEEPVVATPLEPRRAGARPDPISRQDFSRR